MSHAFPFIVEYEYDVDSIGLSGTAHNSATEQSGAGAFGLFELLRESPRIRWARFYKVGEPGDRAEYWRN